jgi:hypothetical protein
LVIVDYHRPHPLNPLYLPMMAMLAALEPFALDLWRHDVSRWFPANQRLSAIEKFTMFGGLYQVLTVTV